jgi:hypothetical protein
MARLVPAIRTTNAAAAIAAAAFVKKKQVCFLITNALQECGTLTVVPVYESDTCNLTGDGKGFDTIPICCFTKPS